MYNNSVPSKTAGRGVMTAIQQGPRREKDRFSIEQCFPK